MRPSHVVVIAYGNPLRGDDGLASHAADELRKNLTFPDVEILQVHQLAPELAENLSRSHVVVFVDASAAKPGKTQPGEIGIVEIGKQESNRATGSPFHHQFSPASLLALAAELYHTTPRAFLATMTGEDFSPGERLSPSIEGAMPEFVARIERLIRQLIKAS